MTVSAIPASAATRGRSMPVIGVTVIAALAAGLAFQGSRALWEPDEGRYAAVALDMTRHGDWAVPHLHPEQLHLTKPPLTYWAAAGSVLLFGESEWALRLPNALAFAAVALLLAVAGRRMWGEEGTVAGLLWATMLLPFAAAAILTTDTLLTLWETLAVIGFVLLRWGAPRPVLGPLLLWLGLGLGFLTKGPPALLPLAAVVAFVAVDEGRAGLRRLAPPWGVALFAATALSWYLWVATRLPGALGYWLGSEVLDRVLTDAHRRNGDLLGAVRVYLPVLLLGTLPWGPAALAAVRERRRGAARERFLLLWLLLPLAVLCLARSRLHLYLLPFLAPVALLAAGRAGAWLRSRRRWVLLGAWVLALLALKAWAGVRDDHRDGRRLAESMPLAAGVSELVFVDEPPLLGLSLYLGAEVESVHLAEPPLYPFEHSLAEELAEARAHERAFVLPARDETAFRAELGRAHLEVATVEPWAPDEHPLVVARIRRSRRPRDPVAGRPRPRIRR